MDNLSKIGIWINRIVLLFVSVLFFSIGIRNILSPLKSAIKSDIVLNSATALSVARVSMGAFPLGFAIIILTSLFLKRGMFGGVLSVFIIVVITTIVRITSLQIDGHSDFGEKVLIPEIILTILSGIGLYLELYRRKMERSEMKFAK
jgi:hypothetical protein